MLTFKGLIGNVPFVSDRFIRRDYQFLFQFLCRSDDVLDWGSRAKTIKSTAEIKACLPGSDLDRNPVYPNSHILTRSNNHGESILSLKLEHKPQLWREWWGDWKALLKDFRVNMKWQETALIVVRQPTGAKRFFNKLNRSWSRGPRMDFLKAHTTALRPSRSSWGSRSSL